MRDYRVSHDLTLETVAGHLHCSEGHIVAIEAGTVAPTDAEVRALATLYGVSAEAITEAADATKMARK